MSLRRFLPLLLLAAAFAAVRPCAGLVRLGATSFVDAPARFGERIDPLLTPLPRSNPSL